MSCNTTCIEIIPTSAFLFLDAVRKHALIIWRNLHCSCTHGHFSISWDLNHGKKACVTATAQLVPWAKMATVPSTHRKKNAACSATLHFWARRKHAAGISFQCCITCSSTEYFWFGARARIIGCPKYSKASRGFEPRSLDSESRVLTVTPRGQLTFCQPDTNHGKRTLRHFAKLLRGSKSPGRSWDINIRATKGLQKVKKESTRTPEGNYKESTGNRCKYVRTSKLILRRKPYQIYNKCVSKAFTGLARIWTAIAGFNKQSAHRYTTRPCNISFSKHSEGQSNCKGSQAKSKDLYKKANKTIMNTERNYK